LIGATLASPITGRDRVWLQVTTAVLLGLAYSYIFSFVLGLIVSSEVAGMAVRAFNPFLVSAIEVAIPLAALLASRGSRGPPWKCR
jgi:hypothetical protein